MLERVWASPLWVRVLPFVVFAALTSAQGWFGEPGRYWIYLAKTLVGAWLIWSVWPVVREMRWAMSWEAGLVGVAVFGLWVGLDGWSPKWSGTGKPWNPLVEFESSSGLAGMFVLVRLIGSSVVVPPLEEVFYRSFLYRYVASPNFQSIALDHFAWTPLLVTAAIFGAAHPDQWLAALLCGLAYQGLVIRKKRLGDAMTAHALTNLLLGLWVIWKGAWHFW